MKLDQHVQLNTCTYYIILNIARMSVPHVLFSPDPPNSNDIINACVQSSVIEYFIYILHYIV